MRVLKPDEKGGSGGVVDSGEGVLCEYVLPPHLLLVCDCNLQLARHHFQPRLGSIDYSLSQHTGPLVLPNSSWILLVNSHNPELTLTRKREKQHFHNQQIVGGLPWRNGVVGRLGSLWMTSLSSSLSRHAVRSSVYMPDD
jgi:hypothetical protein